MKSRFRTAAVNSVITLGVLALLSLALPGLPQWITDNGNKYIVMRNYAEHGTTGIAHPAPEFFPDGNFHFVRHRGEMRSFYAEYYPVLASYPFRRFGERALMWLSMLGTALTAGLLSTVLRRRGSPLLIAFATPLLFFSFLLWEMSLSVCFAAGAWLLLLNRKHFAAGIVLGASLLLREEAYFLAFAFAAALAGSRDFKGAAKCCAGFVSAALWIWLYQYLAFGHILGLHGGTYYLNNLPKTVHPLAHQLKMALWNYWHHLWRFAPFQTGWANWLCLAPVVGAVAAGALTERKWEKLKRGVAAAALAAWGALILRTLPDCHSEDIAFRAAMITGAVATNPLFLPFYLNWRRLWSHRRRSIRLSARAATIYLLAVPPLLTASDIGLIYGARHFLAVMPLLLFAGAYSLRRDKPGFKAAAALAVLLQGMSIVMLYHVATEASELEKTLGAMPGKTLVTDAFFLPEQTPRLFFDRTVLKLDDGNVGRLIGYLRSRGEAEFTLVLSNRYRRIGDAGVMKLLAAAPPTAEPLRFKRSPGSGFMDLYILNCRLK